MQQLHILVYDPNGNPIPFKNGQAIVTNKTRNTRFGNDLQIHNPYLFTYTYFGNGKNLSNDKIEFYISKPNSMSVDHRFKLEQIKFNDLPVAKDSYGHEIMINTNKVRTYQFKINPFIIITDENGNKIPNAEVRLNGVKKGKTDNAGQISVGDFKNKLITILKTGFNPLIVKPKTNNPLQLNLQSNPNIKYIKTLRVFDKIQLPGGQSLDDLMGDFHIPGFKGLNAPTISVFLENKPIQKIDYEGYILAGNGNEIVKVKFGNTKIFEKKLSELQDIQAVNYDPIAIIKDNYSNNNQNNNSQNGNSQNSNNMAQTNNQIPINNTNQPPVKAGINWKPIAIALIGGAILTKLFSGENKKGMNAQKDIDYEEIEKPIEAEI